MKDKKKYARTLLRRYIKLMRFAQNRDPKLLEGIYTEKHHAFPVSIYGKNSTLVVLTYKEHLVAHHLLYKGLAHRYGEDNRKSIKMGYALRMLIQVDAGSGKRNKVKVTLKGIKAAAKRIKGRAKISVSQETRELMSASQRGEKNHQYGKPLKPETIKKLSEALSGVKNPFYGRAHTDETKSQISAARVGKTAGEQNPSYDPTTYTWYNYRYDILETRLSLYQLRKKYPDLASRDLSSLKTKKAKHSHDWIIVEGPLESLGIELLDKVNVKLEYLVPRDWLDLKTDTLELKLTVEELINVYPEYNLHDIRALVRGSIKIHSGLVLLDKEEVLNYSYQNIIIKYTSIYPRFIQENWIHKESGLIELGFSAYDLETKYPYLNRKDSKLVRVIRRCAKSYLGWELLSFKK